MNSTMPRQNEEVVSAAKSANLASPRLSGSTMCFFCGNSSRQRSSCPARDITCYSCIKKGHFSKFCRSGKRLESKTTGFRHYQPTVASLQPYTPSDSTINVKVNNYSLPALIDDGSTDSFIKTA